MYRSQTPTPDPLTTSEDLRLRHNLHRPRLPVRLPRVHLLARLLDRRQHRLVAERRLGDHGRGLGFEGYFVGFDACVGGGG